MTIVIPRSVWKPRHDNGVEVIGTQEWLNAGKELWLHHSITNPPGPDATLEQDCEHMRTFEQIGENRYGAGISYTWVVMPSGRVFQGHDIDRQGTHTYQRNNRSRAICLAGNFDINPLPDKMARSVALLLVELGATLDGGHRNVFATACPGEYAFARIPQINNWASTGHIPGDDMPLNADTDYEAFKTMLQRFLVFESRDKGAAPTWENGPTVYERLTGLVESTNEIKALVEGTNADVNELKRKVEALETGGVSEERIGEIAVDAVNQELND